MVRPSNTSDIMQVLLTSGLYSIWLTGADPGFRRGGFVHSEGGGVRTGISGADPNCCRALGKSTSKKKLQTAVGGEGGGGGSDHPKKTPVSAHC